MHHFKLVSFLEKLLGDSYTQGAVKGNLLFYSPFCDHYKPKLSILIDPTSNEHPWRCWISECKGKTIHSLLYRMNIPTTSELYAELNSILGIYKLNDNLIFDIKSNYVNQVLPDNFKYLITDGIPHKDAHDIIDYINIKRNISDDLIERYKLGFTNNKTIIIPSFTKHNKLNYFAYKNIKTGFYCNCTWNRNTVFFENTINYSLPITIVEGGFDAISVRRNATPLYGKYMNNFLIKTIIDKKVPCVNIMLDSDTEGQKSSNVIANHLIKYGISFKKINIIEKDANDSEFDYLMNTIHNTSNYSASSFLLDKFGA